MGNITSMCESCAPTISLLQRSSLNPKYLNDNHNSELSGIKYNSYSLDNIKKLNEIIK